VVSDGRGQPAIQVTGTAAADRFAKAWIEVGSGEAPTGWRKASDDVRRAVENGPIAVLPAALFQGSSQFTIRLVVEHADGRKREARFLLNVG
jgi:hypothetical protein